MSVDGPQTETSAPIVCSPKMFERATRLLRMSPTMHTRSPFRDPNFSRSVYMSSSPCVGCSWHPSPALITFAFTTCVRKCAAPAEA